METLDLLFQIKNLLSEEYSEDLSLNRYILSSKSGIFQKEIELTSSRRALVKYSHVIKGFFKEEIIFNDAKDFIKKYNFILAKINFLG